MNSHIWVSESKDQDDIYEEKQEISPSYATVGLDIPEHPPPAYSHLQSPGWQHQHGGVMDMDMLSAWQTDRILNTDQSLMFEWQPPSPLGIWDAQNRNLATHIHTTQAEHIPSEPLVPTDCEFPEPLFRFDKNAIWQVGWTGETSHIVEGVVGLVESSPEPMSHHALVSFEMADQFRPAKRRRKASSPDFEAGEEVTPTAEGPTHAWHPHSCPSSISDQSPEQPCRESTASIVFRKFESMEGEDPVHQTSARTAGQQRESTPTIQSAETVEQPMESAPISPTPIPQTTFQPRPSARVISDQRDSPAKLRRGGHAVFKTQSTNSKRGHYASEVWEGHKAAIQKLYIDERKPLREVIKIMEKNHNFPAT